MDLEYHLGSSKPDPEGPGSNLEALRLWSGSKDPGRVWATEALFGDGKKVRFLQQCPAWATYCLVQHKNRTHKSGEFRTDLDGA